MVKIKKKKVKTITFSELRHLSMLCKTTGTYNMGGRKMRDVGIGFIDEGKAYKNDVLVTEDDGTVPKESLLIGR